MTSKELNQVLTLIRKLTPSERSLVIKAIAAQDGNQSSPVIRNSEDWLLPGLEYELKRRGILLTPLRAEMVKRIAPNFAQDSTVMRAALKKALKRTVTQAELLTLGRICARALANYILMTRPPDFALGPKALLQGVPELAAALNASFPGYLAGGMLAALICV